MNKGYRFLQILLKPFYKNILSHACHRTGKRASRRALHHLRQSHQYARHFPHRRQPKASDFFSSPKKSFSKTPCLRGSCAASAPSPSTAARSICTRSPRPSRCCAPADISGFSRRARECRTKNRPQPMSKAASDLSPIARKATSCPFISKPKTTESVCSAP